MPRPKNPSKMLETAKSIAMEDLIEVAKSMRLEELVRLSMNSPDPDLDGGRSETSLFRFDVDVRETLIQLAKLEKDKARSEAFVQDVEEVVNDYFRSREMSKRRPGPASQRAGLLEIRKYATKLQELLAFMDPDTKDTYCRSVPFPYENVWMDHRMTVDHIIHTTVRAERRLSEDVKPGKRKNTDLENLFPSLWLCARKYFPSLNRETFGTLAQTVCEGAEYKGEKIKLPDHTAGRFLALIDPPFPPKPPRKLPR